MKVCAGEGELLMHELRVMHEQVDTVFLSNGDESRLW